MVAIIYFAILFLIAGFLIYSSVFISGLVYSVLMGAPFVPTKKKEIEEVFKYAKFKPGMRFLELGCGDGRMVSEAVKKYGIYGKGIEVNPVFITVARIRKWLLNTDMLELVRHDVRKTSFENFDVIYLYLFPRLIEKIQDKFLSECKPRTLIVSHGFRVDNLADKLEYTREVKPFKTFFYRI